MKRLLRSIIDLGDNAITQDQMVGNIQRLISSGLEWPRPEDQRIFDYLKWYYQQRMELPNIQTLKDYFEGLGSVGAIEVTERLKDIEAAPWYVRSNFLHLVQTLKEDQNKAAAVALLKEAHEIITKGIEVKDGKDKIRRQGVRDALIHFSSQALPLIQADSFSRTEGNVCQDGQEVWDTYQAAKADTARALGRFSGINEIDTVCHGIKPGELWVHAAFPGELKTMVAANWVYNLSTRYHANTLYFTLEMPYEQMRRIFYAIHTAKGKWSGIHAPLDYRKIRDGTLTPDEEQFLKTTIEDLNNNSEYHPIHVVAPDHDVTIADIRLHAEMLHKKDELGLIVIDHGQLVTPMRRHKDYVIELNSVVRDAKKLALHFNHGQKIPVLMLFQINRQGKDEAVKNGGRYKASAVAYANEIEKSADVITTTFLDDEHRLNGTTLICNLKNRDNPLFKPFTARVFFEPRRIKSMDQYTPGGGISIDKPEGYGDFLSGDV
ncbi:MAG: DnaB-like helicase C-terminal domain-containing protein [Parcubacteria group bacterium]|jgi:replicative DNA helicase